MTDFPASTVLHHFVQRIGARIRAWSRYWNGMFAPRQPTRSIFTTILPLQSQHSSDKTNILDSNSSNTHNSPLLVSVSIVSEILQLRNTQNPIKIFGFFPQRSADASSNALTGSWNVSTARMLFGFVAKWIYVLLRGNQSTLQWS